MTKYAAFDHLSIYATGNTPDEAVARAVDMVRDPEAKFDVAKISNELFQQIESDGWDGNRQSFDIVDGIIIDTTSR